MTTFETHPTRMEKRPGCTQQVRDPGAAFITDALNHKPPTGKTLADELERGHNHGTMESDYARDTRQQAEAADIIDQHGFGSPCGVTHTNPLHRDGSLERAGIEDADVRPDRYDGVPADCRVGPAPGTTTPASRGPWPELHTTGDLWAALSGFQIAMRADMRGIKARCSGQAAHRFENSIEREWEVVDKLLTAIVGTVVV